MPRVPYQPFPSVQPSEQGTPNINISTPGAAFGTSIAEAVQGLGKTTEGVGNELFSRAIAMQELKNETEARENATKFDIEVGKIHAEYNALEGKDRVNAFEGYANSIQDLRKKYREGISTDSAARMFDAQSWSTVGRTIFSGAVLAGEAQKQWSKSELVSQMSVDSKTTEDDPNNEVLFQRKLRQTRENAANLSALQGHGAGSAQEKDLMQQATSTLWSQRIIGLSRTAPSEATRLLDAHKTELTQKDYLRVDGTVRAQSRAVDSVNIANEEYEGGTALGLSMKEMEDEVRAKAKRQSPDDPILAQHAVQSLQTRFNQAKHSETIEEQQNRSIVDGAILDGAKNIQELRADPRIATAIDALPKDKQLAIPGMIQRYQDRVNKDTNVAADQRMRGMSTGDVSAIRQFIDLDLTKQDLNQADIRKWQKIQDKLRENPTTDPRVSHAMSVLQGSIGKQLEAVGVYKRTENNKDDYDNFKGALSSSLDLWKETHGKPASDEDIIKTIAPQLLRQQTQPGAIFGNFWPNKSDPLFKRGLDTTPAAKWMEDYKQQILSEGGSEPSKEQLERAYIRGQLRQFYPATKGDKK